MSTPRPDSPDLRLSRATRDRFVTALDGVVLDLAATVQGRLSVIAEQPSNVRDQQVSRDALLDYLRLRDAWVQGVRQVWAQAIDAPQDSTRSAGLATLISKGLSLIGDDEIEKRILASRIALTITDKVSWELNDLRLRLMAVEPGRDLTERDVLKPETFATLLVNQWEAVGLSRASWISVQDSVTALLTERMLKAYQQANELLVGRGVMPEIDRKALVRRTAGTVTPGARPSTARASGGRPEHPAAPSAGRADDGGGGRAVGYAAGGDGGGYPGAAGGEGGQYATATPLGRARQRVQGMFGQIKRLLVDRGIAEWLDGGVARDEPQKPSPALADAMREEPRTRLEPPPQDTLSPSDVQALSVQLRQRSNDLKRKTSSSAEKATIEIVALMFQSILAEDRIPAGVRVWFARLQMPVLRVALAEPEFFGTLQHPARQLIDRMGSCVMGFDSSGARGAVVEAEIRRVVQVIEQYPETGRKVFQLVLDEFQKFLARFLTDKEGTKRLVSLAQQVEQKETLAIQYTIELRSMLNKIKVRDEIREFLFKVWAEVLAVAALRQGPQHADTLALKRVATSLLWAASAKPNREDRARVIQELPQVLQRLRQGMGLLGLSAKVQDAHIKTLSDTLSDAFMSKTEAIPQEQIDDMARRLERLEDVISDDDAAGDIVLDPGTLEVMLGVDVSTFEVLPNGGAQPSAAMMSWAQELELGDWFVLDHNGKVGPVQLVWRSDRRQLFLFSADEGSNYLIQSRRLAAYLEARLLVPAEDEALTIRATREALTKLDANPERLLS
jgi:hypothetical protein